jgi:hypothetical protein
VGLGREVDRDLAQVEPVEDAQTPMEERDFLLGQSMVTSKCKMPLGTFFL